MLDNWSLNITPVITVTPLEPRDNGTATTFQIGFPLQQLSGTYTIQLGPNILDTFGDALDTNQNAGLDVLRDQGQNSPTTTVTVHLGRPAQGDPAPTGSGPGELPDHRARQFPRPGRHDDRGDQRPAGSDQPHLSQRPRSDGDAVSLRPERGPPGSRSRCSARWGSGTNTANFTNTVFDDNAGTPIQNGSAPFFATFNPQHAAGYRVRGPERPGDLDSGHPERIDDQRHRHLQQLVADLSEAIANHGPGRARQRQLQRQFPHLHAGPDRCASSQAWTAVGPAAISGIGAAAGSRGLAIDPSDPSGNTVYVAGASGGIWKTTDFLTTNPNGPTYIPLTNFGPTSGVNIGSITVFPRNHDPNESIIIAATGEGRSQAPLASAS